jgi:hypothetical protein
MAAGLPGFRVKLLAFVNHPNIAAIYGPAESGGTSFLVLELVEGERWRIGSELALFRSRNP